MRLGHVLPMALLVGCTVDYSKLQGTRDGSVEVSGTGGSGIDAGGSGGKGGASGSGGTAGASGAGGSAGSGGAGGKGSGGSAGAPGSGGSGSGGSKWVGNITTAGAVRTDFIKYWNAISPELEGAWQSVELSRDVMSWAKLDAIHTFAKNNGIPAMGHCFLWGSMQPAWLSALSPTDQALEAEEWIQAFCGRYPDVKLVTVVNEPPPHTTPVVAAALGGAGASGYDWIVKAFKMARLHCPKATLIMNDYNNIEYAGQNQSFIAIVKAIQAAGAPIDAIGAQAHEAYRISTGTVKTLLDNLATETGLPVYITEYDVDMSDDVAQKAVMMDQFPMFYTHPSVRGISLWGYISGSTWRQYSGLMSPTGVMRPAMTWLMTYLGRPTN